VNDTIGADFPRTRTIVPVLEVLPEARSTNDVLSARSGDLPDLSAVVTLNQTGGRGRLGRVWVSPPGKALAVSVLLKPHGLPREALGWFPLLAGLAMSRALTPLVPAASGRVAVKWPNDVLIGGAKVCGILTELLPGRAPGEAVAGLVVGAGVNLALDRQELPTDSSTSLALAEAATTDPDAVLSAYLIALTTLYRDFVSAGGDAERSALRDEVAEACETIGRPVRVELPAGGPLLGTAVGLDRDGRLMVDSDGRRTAVAAGDVTHLRY
jgi:BirA family biotin operon repressor/biotin-[acetyl-CoA-carboxylase] ligase